MSIAKYRAFIKTVESGSLTEAAKILGYSQPGISHMISSLEKETGLQLLIRNKDQVLPTENGKKILYYCYQIIKNENYLQETVSSINGLLAGTINIGAYNSLLQSFVPELIRIFSTTYSNISFHIREQAYSDFQENLPKGIIDIGFMSNDVPKNFEFIPLFWDPVCLLIKSDHPLATYERVPVHLINGCDFIMPLPGYDDLIQVIQQRKTIAPHIRHFAASDAALLEMVALGLGASVISLQQARRLPEGVIIKNFNEDFHRDLGIAIKSQKHTTPAIREFIRLAQELSDKKRKEGALPL